MRSNRFHAGSLLRFAMIISATFLLVACVSATFRVEPETSQAGLAIGRIDLKASDFSSRPFSMSGTHSELTGVELTFESSNGIETIAKTRNGYFYIYDILGKETFRLKRLYYKRTTSDGWRTFETWVEGGSEEIRIKPATVINLGIIEWVVSGGSSAMWNIHNDRHREIESWFRETFIESVWLGTKWETAKVLSSNPRLRWEWFYEYH
jgi:hypothetical protein